MTRAPERTAQRRQNFLWAALVVAVTAWNGGAVAGFGFVAWDDDINILFNPHLGPPDLRSLEWMFTDATYMRRYVPLGWLGFSVVFGFSGLSPVGYHLAGLALHSLNALLVFAIVHRLLVRGKTQTAPAWILASAAVGALLWSLHPFRAEIVGWASGLFYAQAGCFALLSVWAYLRSQDAAAGAQGRWRMLALVLQGCSLLSYPLALGLPVVFIALDEWRARADNVSPTVPATVGSTLRRWLRGKIPFVLLSVVIASLTLVARFRPGEFWTAPPGFETVTWVDRLARGFFTWAYYLWKTVWPTELTPAATGLMSWQAAKVSTLLSVAVVMGISASVYLRRRQNSGAGWLWFVYLGLLFPLLGFTEAVHYTADRYVYLASIPLGVAVAFLLGGTASRWRGLAAVGAGAGLVVLAILQKEQLQIWRGPDALFARVVAVAKEPIVRDDAYRRWTRFHAQREEVDAARRVAAEARARASEAAGLALTELAATYAAARPETHGNELAFAAETHAQAATIAARAGRSRVAHVHFEAALALAPTAWNARYNFAVYAALQGDPRHALHLYFGGIAGMADISRGSAAWSPAAKVRLLGLIARAFAAEGQPRLAVGALRLAVAQAATPAEVQTLTEEMARYRSDQ